MRGLGPPQNPVTLVDLQNGTICQTPRFNGHSSRRVRFEPTSAPTRSTGELQSLNGVDGHLETVFIDIWILSDIQTANR